MNKRLEKVIDEIDNRISKIGRSSISDDLGKIKEVTTILAIFSEFGDENPEKVSNKLDEIEQYLKLTKDN